MNKTPCDPLAILLTPFVGMVLLLVLVIEAVVYFFCQPPSGDFGTVQHTELREGIELIGQTDGISWWTGEGQWKRSCN